MANLWTFEDYTSFSRKKSSCRLLLSCSPNGKQKSRVMWNFPNGNFCWFRVGRNSTSPTFKFNFCSSHSTIRKKTKNTPNQGLGMLMLRLEETTVAIGHILEVKRWAAVFSYVKNKLRCNFLLRLCMADLLFFASFVRCSEIHYEVQTRNGGNFPDFRWRGNFHPPWRTSFLEIFFLRLGAPEQLGELEINLEFLS